MGGVIWLVLGIGLCIGSIELGLGKIRTPGSGLLPFLSGIALAVLGVILISSTFSKGLGEDKKEVDQKAGRRVNWDLLRLPVFTFLTLMGYILLLEPLGFLFTTFFSLFFLFKIADPKRWVIPLLSAVITVTLSYLIFEVWLRCQLPRGILSF